MEKVKKEVVPKVKSTEEIYREMREIAKRLPTPSGAEMEDKSGQFGNNFYLLFMGICDENPKPMLEVVYLKKMNKLYGEQWKKFLEDNADLIAKIEEALKQEELNLELLRNFSELLFTYKNSQLADKIAEEINLDGIGNDAWNKLNPLLKQASEAMKKYGINPEEFYS